MNGRLVGTGALSVAASSLWMCAITLPGSEPSALLIAVGVLAPWAVSLPTLALMEYRIARDDVRVSIEDANRAVKEVTR